MEFRFVRNRLGLARREFKNGLEYVVAPVISAKEQVMNGLLYLVEELGRSTSAWDGVPVTLAHPQKGGVFISAKESGVVTFGRVAGSHFGEKSLKNELWIDLAQAQADGAMLVALQRIENGQVVEVSIGLFCDIEPSDGVFNGQAYSGVCRNIRPDHIAILVDETGACSVHDGCGVPRVNQEEQPMGKIFQVHIELSLDEQQSAVYQAWYRQFGWESGSIRDVYPDRVIVRTTGEMWQYGYTIDEQGQVVFAERVQVDYAPAVAAPAEDAEAATNVATNQAGWLAILKDHISHLFSLAASQGKAQSGPGLQEVETVNRDELVKKLVANSRCPLGAESLGKLADNELVALETSLAAQPAAAVVEQPISREVISRVEFEALVQQVGVIGDFIKANTDRAKTSLVEQIALNSDLFSREELTVKPQAELEKLARLVIPADYSGRGLPVVNSGEWEAYQSPGAGGK